MTIAAQPREREDERPSFSLGISPPASQPSEPSQPTVLKLEILEEVVVDARVIAALKFAKATSSEPTLPASEVYKTPEKNTKITNKLIEKCYHWMTHVKQTKDGTNEYEPVFVLKHEALYEGLREYFIIHSMILNKTKVKRYQETIYIVPLDIVYAHHRQFLDKRKLASHPFLFVPICNGAHWWLWIADVNKKKFYVLDSVNKLPEDIHDSRKKLNKFVVRINNFSYEGLCWGGTLNGGWTGSRSRVYPTKWSTYKGEIDSFRYQYGPHLLFHEMNKIRDQVIWESQVIRLPKPSATLSSPYCQYTSGNLDSK
ncbi:hypothetical protein Ahy_B03g064567 [Arachis hypogaea]|uniref:Ubiquitin-like protease family profile domain-containing protein n=1 Tax=Arachis hypogaea TaxID=3818 RepID=A0A444ZZW1_ARAHY|nr:hypothetical protein Ahy_B03g064567 [Arachis hypogaea]